MTAHQVLEGVVTALLFGALTVVVVPPLRRVRGLRRGAVGVLASLGCLILALMIGATAAPSHSSEQECSPVVSCTAGTN